MKRRVSPGTVVFTLFLLFATGMVTKSVLAGPQTVPGEKELKKTERKVAPAPQAAPAVT